MKIDKQFLVLVLISLTIAQLHSQSIRLGQNEHICGFSKAANRSLIVNAENREGPCSIYNQECWGFGHNSCNVTSIQGCTYRIPVAYHIVRETDSNGGIDSITIDMDLESLNTIFAEMNVEFYECCPRDFIDNSDLYDFETFNGDEEALMNITYKPNVINVYIVDGGAQSGTMLDPFNFCGYAYFPPFADIILMNRLCMGDAETMAHEVGHFYGLSHPHEDPSGQTPRTVQENPNNDNSSTTYCDCFTSYFTGDGIGDTAPDPILNEDCQNNCIVDGSCNLAFGPGMGPSLRALDCFGDTIIVNLGDYNPNLDNIMNYSPYSSCEAFEFTPCQKAKMVSVMTTCRTNICCTEPEVHLISQNKFTICPGDPIPTFIASSDCYDWYDETSEINPVITNSASFTPNMDSNLIKEHIFYLSESNSNEGCRIQLSITVLSTAGNAQGNGMVNIDGCSNSGNINFTSNDIDINSCESIGYWVTMGQPISQQLSNGAEILNELSNASIGGPVTPSANVIFKSTSGMPLNSTNLNLNCDNLNIGADYFITPFVSTCIPGISEVVLDCNSNPQFCANSTSYTSASCLEQQSGGQIFIEPFSNGQQSTDCLVASDSQWEISITMNSFGSCDPDSLRLIFNDLSGVSYKGDLVVNSNTNNYIVADSDLTSFNIEVEGLRIFTIDTRNSVIPGCCGPVEYQVELTVAYPEVTGISFPSTNLAASDSEIDCFFGDPVKFSCSDCSICNSSQNLGSISTPAVSIVNSNCPSGQNTPSGGSISAPSQNCPQGSTLQYSIDQGNSWSSAAPLYDQMNSVNIMTRCNCDSDDSISSMITSVMTEPATCSMCPQNLATSQAPNVNVINSICSMGQSDPNGGELNPPSQSCANGSSIQYSIDGGITWNTNIPNYDQMNVIAVSTRCNCNEDNNVSSMISTVATMPASCDENCPSNLASIVAPSISVTNSICPDGQTSPSGGTFSPPIDQCPSGSELQYSTNNGTNWSTVTPSYNQSNSITVLTRCNCDSNNSVNSMVNSIITNPGECTSAEPIPTMGEWGLICLSLLLMIFGVTAIKNQNTLVMSS